MILSMGKWKINVDAEATRAFYAGAPEQLAPCGCPGCRNFRRAIGYMPLGAAAILRAAGADPVNPAEQWVCGAQEDGRSLLCGAFWYLCGRIVSGPRGQACAGEADGVRYSIGTQCALAPEGFPEPVLQLTMTMTLPWLLEEENSCEHQRRGK